MKKLLIFISILGLSYFGKSQSISNLGVPTSTVNAKGSFLVDSLFVLPLRDTVFPPSYNVSLRKTGAMVVKGTNIYYYNSSSWVAFSTGVIDTTSLSNRINERVKYSDSNTVYVPKYGVDTARSTLNSNINARVKYTDTSSMLAPYLRSIDTASLSSRINLKLNISDTSSMLTPYLRKIDTASLSNRINLKLSIADSTTAYVTPTRLADTATVLRGLIPTVPTIYYQTIKRNGTPYTQQPTLDFSTQFTLNDNIGTSATDVSVSALAQSVVTGLTDSLNARVRYVDTSGMLAPYLREVDTASLSSRIDLKAPLASPPLTGSATITNTTDITLGSESALRVGGASNSTNITLGEYSSVLGIQGRNNGASANIFLQPLGGGVSIGDGALTGNRAVAVNNTGAGTGDYASIEIRNGSAGTDALRLYTTGTGFTPSGSNGQDAVAITSGTGISGGMSIGTLANATFRVFSNNVERWVLDGSGNTIITGKFTSSGGGLGYSTGAGGTVTQATSKSTGVTLNKLSGQITMNNASLAANGEKVFTLTNSFIEATDVVVVCLGSSVSAGRYMVGVATVSAGSCQILITNLSSVASEAPVINFAVIKAVNN
jgi:hypothetical protein